MKQLEMESARPSVGRSQMIRFAVIFALLVPAGCGAKPEVDTHDAAAAPMTATVVSYKHNAEWDHFDDGSFQTRDTLTLRLESNESLSLSISLSPGDLSDDSPFRVAGTRFTFSVDDALRPDVHLAWGAINNPTVIQ